MIYTITTNPSIDYYIDCKVKPEINEINRTTNARMYPGGKGVNVSIVLARLGIPTCAMGFSAGRIGELLTGLLKEEGCQCEFSGVENGETRINTKIQYPDGETAFNGEGPAIGQADAKKLLASLKKLTPKDWLVLSGNLQKSISDFYKEAIAAAKEAGAKVVIDTSGEAFVSILQEGVDLAKPNLDELNELFKLNETEDDGIVGLAAKLQEMGCKNVLVSMGGDGALLLTEDQIVLRSKIECSDPVVSTVGAGDSMVAGFLAGLEKTGSWKQALLFGTAAGSGTAFSEGLVTEAAADHYARMVQISEIIR